MTRWAMLLLLVMGTVGWCWQPAGIGSWYYPAYFQPGNPPQVKVFPLQGVAITVALPGGLSANIRALAFSSEGDAVYAQTTDPLDRTAGIYKIEFQPTRYAVVPGSVGMGEAWCLAVSKPSGTVIVAGWSWSKGAGGVFEIDPHAGTNLRLSSGVASGCGGGGVLSPDSKRAVTKAGNRLGLLTLKTGVISAINGTSADMQVTWSPNGQWIAGAYGGTITLIDADGATRSRRLGRSGNGPMVWSPDSRYLLLKTSPLSCAFTPYGASLEVLDIRTGRRREVRSSHCAVTAGTIGWLNQGSAP
jgi:WD40 repeat protein